MKTAFPKNWLLASLMMLACSNVEAAEPSGYYSSCENKGGKELLQALYDVVGSPSVVSYSGLWTLYATSDVHPNGKIWDMYSTKEWTYESEQCGNYKLVGDCYNREHSFPKSWFSEAAPMKSDAFHIYPTDGKVNGQRSNYPFGECENGTYLAANGSIKPLGRLGTSTFSGYSGKVFEPDDEYKGDFARSYFYMAAAYYNRISGWSSDMLARNSYPAFSTWAVNLLLKWHRQDPVSQKELDRVEVVYEAQHNRNPFIDHPELVEYIWGDKASEKWHAQSSTDPDPDPEPDPQIITPVSGSSIQFGTVTLGESRSKVVNVRGQDISSPVSVSVSGTGFSASASSLSASAVNATAGASLTLSFSPSSFGDCSGVLTLASGSATSTVSLTGSGVVDLTALPAAEISPESFTARWAYAGDEDPSGNYFIEVRDADGKPLDGISRYARARSESCVIDGLDQMTAYSYVVQSVNCQSNEIFVTTAQGIPSIDFLYDGDLDIKATAGQPSEAYEIILDIDYVDTDIVVSVDSPFQVSSDKADWGASIVVSPEEDRFFLRVFSDRAGIFTSSLRAAAGSYLSDNASVTATVTEKVSGFFEDFEAACTNSYSVASVTGSAADWSLSDAGVYNVAYEASSGSNYLRLGKSASSSFAMASGKTDGIGVVSFLAAPWTAAESPTLVVEYSSDGDEWIPAAELTVTGNAKYYSKYSVSVNSPDAAFIRFRQTAGGRACFDDIALSDCKSSGIQGVESNYRSWSAFSRGGSLVIDLQLPADVAVHGADGITYFRGAMAPGENRLALAPGLYIVVVGDFSRRVLVK